MGCPKCQAENKPSASYCLQCGYRLADSAGASASAADSGSEASEKPVRGRADGRKKTMVMTPQNNPMGDPESRKKGTEVLGPGKREPSKTPVETRRPAAKTSYFPPGENPLAGPRSAAKPAARRKLRGWMASFDFEPNGQSWELSDGRNILGRDPAECTILLDKDGTVSRKHSVIMVRENEVYVKDLDSEYGTWVEGKELGSGSCELHDGDKLTLCGYTLTIKLL